MARSNERYSKRQKEQKRLKQKQEKQEKLQQRRSENSGKTKSLEDMLAYVDEHGNLVDTPPEPATPKNND